ncbi:MAG: GNAT family N-acetyltransferase [Bdellovibrionota bacterium]
MNTTGKFLAVTKGDALWSQVLILDETYFPRAWKEAEWNSVEFSRHKLWAYTHENRLVGYALFATVPGDETAHLLKILVHPEARGTQTAGLFWKEISQSLQNHHFKNVYLEVEESNERARRFYARLGFVVLRRVKSYYSDGESGVMMQLTL